MIKNKVSKWIQTFESISSSQFKLSATLKNICFKYGSNLTQLP